MQLPFRKQNRPSQVRRTLPVGRVPVFSYHAQRSAEAGQFERVVFRPAVNGPQSRSWLKLWLNRVCVLVLLLAIGWGLTRLLIISPNPEILPFDQSSAALLRDAPVYQQAARKLFSSVLNRTKLTANTVAIGLRLKQEFPELAVVSVRLPLIGSRPQIYIKPAVSVIALTADNGESYVVDQTGHVVRRITASEVAGLPLTNVKDGDTITRLGQQALSVQTVAFIQELIFQLSYKHLTVSYFVLPAGKSELDMYLHSANYFVKFNVADYTPDQQVGTLFAIVHDLQGKGITPSQYIDVRVEGRAYYQ